MSNEKHPINGLMDSSMQNLRSLVDANTMMGEPIIAPDGTMIIPVSKVTFGFCAGGSDIPTVKTGDPFGGGSGGGVTMQPVAFLVIRDGNVELLQMNDNKSTADRVVGMMPEMVDKISGLFHGEKNVKSEKNEPKESERETATDKYGFGLDLDLESIR